MFPVPAFHSHRRQLKQHQSSFTTHPPLSSPPLRPSSSSEIDQIWCNFFFKLLCCEGQVSERVGTPTARSDPDFRQRTDRDDSHSDSVAYFFRQKEKFKIKNLKEKGFLQIFIRHK
jgi:hypothetical protein